MNSVPSSPPIMQSPPGPTTVIDGHRYLYFAGTGYLGLAGRREVIQAARAAVRQFGVHTATSRTGFGHNPLTLEVERLAAKFFGLEHAFYFTSGYAANHIALQVCREKVGAVFVDEAAHYSLLEAARLLGKPIHVFQHRNAADLKRCLTRNHQGGRQPLVIADGVFSASGRVTPVPEYLAVLRRHAPGFLHLDDAHGFGVLGKRGRGTWEHFGLWGRHLNSGQPYDGVVLSVCGTLAKALGGFGGIIPGSREFLQQIRATSHYYEGASAPSAADAGASARALQIIMDEPELRVRLRANVARLRAGLRKLGLPVEEGPAANISIELGDAAHMQRIHQRLKNMGILVPYIAAYAGTGPQGILRFAVCARHTPAMIERLLAALKKVLSL